MNLWAIKSESPISNDWAIANEMPMSNEWEVEEEETLKEPSLLQKTNKIAGQLAAGITYYSGLEGFGRLWDSPANVGYGIWEGGKKALKGEGIGQLVKEPIKAAEKTLRGEPYYDLEQAGLPVPEGKIARTGAEIAWAIGKNPLNVLVPWKQYKAIKTTPATITPSQLKKALGKKEAEEIFEVIKEEPVVGKPAVPEVKKSDTARINALLKEVEGEAGVKVKVKVKAEQPWEIAQETALDESGKFKEVFKEGERGKPEDIMTPPGPAKEIYSYEGKQFKTYQLKESTAEKGKADNSKWKVETSEGNLLALGGEIDTLKSGSPGRRNRVVDYDGTEHWSGESSTYPEWFRNQGWTKDEAIGALEAARKGKPLGIKQTGIVEAAVEYFGEMEASSKYKGKVIEVPDFLLKEKSLVDPQVIVEKLRKEKDPVADKVGNRDWVFGKYGGEIEAAKRYAKDNWPETKSKHLKRQLDDPENTVFLTVPGSSGKNMHTYALAEKIKNDIGGKVIEGDIYFDPIHTKQSKDIPKWYRIFNERKYEHAEGRPGTIKEIIGKREVVIIDDHATTGGTIKAFIAELEKEGVTNIKATRAYKGSYRRDVGPAHRKTLTSLLEKDFTPQESETLINSLTDNESFDLITLLKRVEGKKNEGEITENIRRLLDRLPDRPLGQKGQQGRDAGEHAYPGDKSSEQARKGIPARPDIPAKELKQSTLIKPKEESFLKPTEPTPKRAPEPWEMRGGEFREKHGEYAAERFERITTGEEGRLSVLNRDSTVWKTYQRDNPQLKSNPQTVIIYRATTAKDLNHGDWVYLRKDMARIHQKERTGAKIISREVPFDDIVAGQDSTEFVWSPRSAKEQTHREIVKQASAEGKPVPKEVLADYPELGKKVEQTGLFGVQKGGQHNLLDLIKSEKGGMDVKVPSLKETIENLPETGVIKGTKEKLKRAGRGISEAAHSPEEVYAKDPAGKKIYKLVDQADQKKNAFLAEQGKALKVAVWKVKEGSEGSVRIGQALDGKISPDKLNPAERKAYDFMKEQYDFLLQKYARTEAGSEEGYLKVLRAAGSKYGAKVKVSELSPESLGLYNRLKSALAKTQKGTERYGKIKEEMDGLLSRGWKETLKPGEQKAHDVLSRKIKDYLPHIFDKEELLDAFRNEVTTIEKKLKTATNKGTITQFKDRLKLLNESIVKMEGGQLVTYDQLPTNVRFRFFETRKGKAGYSFDSVKAYQTYLQGIARKIYDEPAIRQVAELHKELDPSLKSYNKWYVRRYMGWDKHALDEVAGTIASFQWMRTLGLNPRSAIVNLTQRVNTVAEVGVKHSAIGEKLAFTKKGKALFDKTGIAKEIPTVLMEGTVPAGMEKTRAILGFMFNKVELGNRRHAFLSAYSEAKSKGMTEQAAIESGIDIVHKTQFRYGKVGMPKMLTHPVGRLAGQFWSYPIKQIELMTKWAKTPTGRVKLIKYLAMAEGGNYALDEFLGIDLSNALGFGLNYGEAIDALGDLTEGDLRGFWRHTRLTFSSGGGLLPSGLGPTASGVGKVIGAIGKGRGVEQVKKELTPVEGKRIMQAYTAIKNRKGDLFPIYDSKKHLMYYVTKKDLALRTLGPRPAKEGKEYLEWNRERLLEDERKEVLKDQINAIIAHDISKAIKLKTKYGVYPSDKAIENEIERRTLSRREQGRLKAIGQKEEYQLMREGKLIRR